MNTPRTSAGHQAFRQRPAALRAALASALLVVPALHGCAGPPGPIFPAVHPALVWPAPPDVPRIRYLGALRGPADLGMRPRGMEAVRQVVGGKREMIAFARPTAIAVAGERVYVADLGLGAVHLLDLQAREYRLLRGGEAEPLEIPIDLAVIEENLLAVVDRGRAALEIFDLAGNWRRTQRLPEITAPVAIAWDAAQRRTWVADAAAHACFGLTGLEQVSARVGAPGSAPGQFHYPRGLACQADGTLIVADSMNSRVQLFDAAGQVRAAFGQRGDAAGDFAGLRDVAVDAAGHIYALDNQFENVQLFDAQGRLLLAVGQGGAGRGEFALPAGITIDGRNRLWVADSMNRRVQVFEILPEGATS